MTEIVLALALLAVIAWSFVVQRESNRQQDALRRSLDDAVMQIVALKNPFAAQAFATAKQAAMAEHVARVVANGTGGEARPSGDPDEGLYG